MTRPDTPELQVEFKAETTGQPKGVSQSEVASTNEQLEGPLKGASVREAEVQSERRTKDVHLEEMPAGKKVEKLQEEEVTLFIILRRAVLFLADNHDLRIPLMYHLKLVKLKLLQQRSRKAAKLMMMRARNLSVVCSLIWDSNIKQMAQQKYFN